MPPTTPSVTSALAEVFPDAVAAAVAQHLALSPTASMPELAAAAGVSRATLFRRFPTRAALVAELSRAAAGAYVRAVQEARPRSGPADEAFARVAAAVGRLASAVGLLALQPVEEHVEADLLAQAAAADEEVRRLVRRGQEDGRFRVDVDPEWVLAMLTWLGVGAADAVRLGRLTPAAAQRHLLDTLVVAVRRVPARTPEG